MITKLAYSIFILLLYSCDTKPTKHQEVETNTIVIDKQYSFFHNQLLITSKVKPFEEDARNTVSELALTVYTDIKKYSFLNFLQKGVMSITVADFKEVDSSFNVGEHLNEIIKINENTDAFTVSYQKPSILNNKSFPGYWTKGKMTIKGEKSSSMYIGALTNKKTLMTIVAVYDNDNDIDIINNALISIKGNN